MKKTILILVAIVAYGMVSCTKERDCTCTIITNSSLNYNPFDDEYFPPLTMNDTTVGKATTKEKKCSNLNDEVSSTLMGTMKTTCVER